MPSDAEIDALIERLNVLCNPLSEMLPERERLTAFVRDGDEAARFLAALRDERDRLKSGNRYAQLEQQARARVRELEQKLERARLALEPFAREGSKLTPDLDKYSWLNTGLSNANFRHARAALAEIGQRG